MISLTTKAEGIKLKISGDIKEEFELNQSTVCSRKLSKERIHILGLAWSLKLKLRGLDVGEVELNCQKGVSAISWEQLRVSG